MEYPDSDRSSRLFAGILDPPAVKGGPFPRLCNLAVVRVPILDLPELLAAYVDSDSILLLLSSEIRVSAGKIKRWSVKIGIRH